jgi:hypothetical protein
MFNDENPVSAVTFCSWRDSLKDYLRTTSAEMTAGNLRTITKRTVDNLIKSGLVLKHCEFVAPAYP